MKPRQFYNFISGYIDEFNTLKNNFHKYTDSNDIPRMLEFAIRERLNQDVLKHIQNVIVTEFINIFSQRNRFTQQAIVMKIMELLNTGFMHNFTFDKNEKYSDYYKQDFLAKLRNTIANEHKNYDVLDDLANSYTKRLQIIKKRFRWAYSVIDEYKNEQDAHLKRYEKYYEPKNGPLGHYVWPKRHHAIGFPLEANTDVEDRLEGAFYKHFNSNIALDKDSCDLIRLLMNNKLYQTIFVKPKVKTIYRGLSFDIIDDEEFEKFIDKLDTNLVYRPYRGKYSSSWTTDIDAAKNFAGNNKNKSTIILHADVTSLNAQTKLLDVRKLYSYYSFSDYGHEREVIAFGDIPISSYEIQRGIKSEPESF